MAHQVERRSVRRASMSQQRVATGLMRPPLPTDRHPIEPALKGHSAACHCCRHRSAPIESRQTRKPGQTPNPYVSCRSPNAVVSIERTVPGAARGTETSGRPHRSTQPWRAGGYIVLPAPLWTLAVASTPCVHRKDTSYSAYQVHNEKNEQNGSKKAATNIHFHSPLIIDSVLDVGSAAPVWAVPHRSRPANRLRYDDGRP